MTTLEKYLPFHLETLGRIPQRLRFGFARHDRRAWIEKSVDIEETPLSPLFPPYSLILGFGEDQLPFVLELTNPAPGSILIAGDAGCGKRQLLQAALTSATTLNSPEQVVFTLISKTPERYAPLGQVPHCQQIASPDEVSFHRIIRDLLSVAQDRRQRMREGPIMLLAIDDLNACLQSLDDEGVAELFWLARHGPRYRVWSIATLSAEDAQRIDIKLLTSFRTRLIGFIRHRELAANVSGDETLDSRHLIPGEQFLIHFGGGWLRFWIDNPDSRL